MFITSLFLCLALGALVVETLSHHPSFDTVETLGTHTRQRLHIHRTCFRDTSVPSRFAVRKGTLIVKWYITLRLLVEKPQRQDKTGLPSRIGTSSCSTGGDRAVTPQVVVEGLVLRYRDDWDPTGEGPSDTTTPGPDLTLRL